jgi:hypothetical protein
VESQRVCVHSLRHGLTQRGQPQVQRIYGDDEYARQFVVSLNSLDPINSHTSMDRSPRFTRRELLRRNSMGFGGLALAGLFAKQSTGIGKSNSDPTARREPDFEPSVRNVIFCYMSGGFSHVDSFDPKPRLALEAGQPMPFPTERTMFNQDGNIMPSPWTFRQYGESAIPVSDLFPYIASCADDLTVIRSMTAKFMEHAQANFYFHSGMPFTGYPSTGAWVTYGLGTDNDNLPGYVVLGSGGIPLGGINMFGNGFLPAIHQGTFVYPEREVPLANVGPGLADPLQRSQLSFVDALDRNYLGRLNDEPQVEAAIKNYEIAYRMQTAVPELVDLTSESASTKSLYGVDSKNATTAAYARQCLLARRLVERGVRFVELTMVGGKAVGMNNPWDQHGQLKSGHTANALTVDQPIAGLLKDLKDRGLLDQTLVVFSGEFGRTPFVQAADGRDHNPYGFSLWLAGGSLKKGLIYGKTDEYGYRVIENEVTVHDLHATILHLLGIDHMGLTYRFGGRDIRLTDVHGHVVHDIIG